MGRYTDEELEGLTEEEREALEADDDSDENEELEGDDGDGTDEDADDNQPDDSGEDAGDGDDSEGADGSEEASAEGDDAAADGEEGGDGEGPADGSEEAPRRAPILTAEDTGDVDERLTAIGESKDKLIEQFDDGELTAREYQSELDKLAKQEREIEREVFKSELAREMEEQQARNDWLSTVNGFLDDNPQYKQSELMYTTLDTAVRKLAASEENQNLTGAEILEKAHGQIVEQFGLQKEQEPAAKPTSKKPGKRKIEAPTTLAKVPAADMTETENTRWTKLDRLMETDPVAYEQAIDKMPESEREAYLSAQ